MITVISILFIVAILAYIAGDTLQDEAQIRIQSQLFRSGFDVAANKELNDKWHLMQLVMQGAIVAMTAIGGVALMGWWGLLFASFFMGAHSLFHDFYINIKVLDVQWNYLGQNGFDKFIARYLNGTLWVFIKLVVMMVSAFLIFAI